MSVKICSKTFNEVGALRKHKKSVQAELRPHECNICSRTFIQVGSLKRHKQIIHVYVMSF